jgi:signal peptidase II
VLPTAISALRLASRSLRAIDITGFDPRLGVWRMESGQSVPASRYALFWLLAAAGCAIDLATKHWMFSRQPLLDGQVWWLVPGHAGLQLSLNEGALFGMGQGKTWLFAACSATAALAIPAWLFLFGAARDRALTVTLGCIMGGVLGNLYDRTGMPALDWGLFDPTRAGQRVYAVRDFVLLAWRWDDDWQKRVAWPNFNVADMLLVCGAISMLLLSLRKQNPDHDAVAA